MTRASSTDSRSQMKQRELAARDDPDTREAVS